MSAIWCPADSTFLFLFTTMHKLNFKYKKDYVNFLDRQGLLGRQITKNYVQNAALKAETCTKKERIKWYYMNDEINKPIFRVKHLYFEQ